MLTDTACRKAKSADRPFKLSDSGGLHLLVMPTGGQAVAAGVPVQRQAKDPRVRLLPGRVARGSP